MTAIDVLVVAQGLTTQTLINSDDDQTGTWKLTLLFRP